MGDVCSRSPSTTIDIKSPRKSMDETIDWDDEGGDDEYNSRSEFYWREWLEQAMNGMFVNTIVLCLVGPQPYTLPLC